MNKYYEIKHKYITEVLFNGEYKSFKDCVENAVFSKINLSEAYFSGANLSGADLSGAYLLEADLSGASLSGASLFKADLSGADLSGANLSGADLSGAYLFRASLSGADLSEDLKIKQIPIQLLNLRWPIIIFDQHMQIGCEFHSIKNWFNFSDARINNMDCKAFNFWKQNKTSLMEICKANNRK